MAAALSALTFAVAAEPDPISYDYISAKYTWFSSIMNGFPADIDGHATTIDLSIDMRPHIALIGGYTTGKAHVTSVGVTSNADLDSYSFGVVIHAPVNDRTDALLGTSFINGDVKVDGPLNGSEDINGGLSFIGFRSRISDYVELDGMIAKNSITETSSISVSLSAGYFVNDRLSINLGYAKNSQGDAISLGTTKYF
jgi:hypothetical protein